MTSTSSPSSSSSSSSAATSLVTALGGGSGVDMAALASNLAKAQFSDRNDRLTSKSDTLNTRISKASNIKSMLLSLDSSMATLVRSGNLARTPTVADTGVASASLTGATAPSGSYSLEVTQLASKQTLASAAFASSGTKVGAGTLTLRFGSLSGSGFTADASHAAVPVTIPSGATLADVAAAINAAGAGVRAYVANTDDGAQLMLKGPEGAANGFILEASEDPLEPGLSDLAWTPSATTGTLLTSAKNARFKLDGLPMTAASNSVGDAIAGVKLQLASTNGGSPTTVSFSDPATSIASSMRDLVDALNEVMGELNSATAIGGDLANDGGARALKRSLMGLGSQTIMPNAAGAARTLADIGLKTQRDGTFALDSDRLKATIEADPQGVAAMFTNGVHGVYASIDKIYRDASSTANTGSLGGSIARYTKQLDKVTTDKSDLAGQQETVRARLYSQFTTSETRIGTIKSTMTMLENQIAQWNKSS